MTSAPRSTVLSMRHTSQRSFSFPTTRIGMMQRHRRCVSSRRQRKERLSCKAHATAREATSIQCCEDGWRRASQLGLIIHAKHSMTVKFCVRPVARNRCGGCWSTMVEKCVDEGTADLLQCPMPGCRTDRQQRTLRRHGTLPGGTPIDQALIAELLKLKAISAPLKESITHLVGLLKSPSARRCPDCRHVQLGDALHPETICERCVAPYCYHHGDLHPGESCEEVK